MADSCQLDRPGSESDGDVLPIGQDPVELVSTTPESLFEEALSLCRERFSFADRILLLHQEHRALAVRACYGNKAAFVVTTEEISRAIIRRVRRTNRAIVIGDALNEAEFQASHSVKRIGQRSVLCAPVIMGGNTKGLIYIDSASLINAFNLEELRWAIRLATALARALARLERHQEPLLEEPVSAEARRTTGASGADLQPRATEEILKAPPHLRRRPRPSLSDKAVFYRALACMLASGFPVHRSLQLLSESENRFASFSAQLLEDVEKGFPLSRAMSRFHLLFPLHERKLIKVGENSGTLDTTAETIARAVESEVQTRGRLISALLYPTVIFVFCLILILAAPPLFLNDFFENLTQSGVELPWLSQVVMAGSWLISQPVTVLVVFAIAAVARPVAAPILRSRRFENWLLGLPLASSIYKTLLTTRLVRALGLQLEAGLYLDASLRLAGIASGSETVREEMERVITRVMNGNTLEFALRRSSFFPPLLTEFIAVGEETGRVPEMCRVIERLLNFELEEAVETAQGLVEPLIMAVVGLLVGLVALACLLPLVRMVQNFL